MSAITPQTELKLLKCPIEEDNRNQIKFNNITAQTSYFNSLPSLDVDNFTYQRHNGVIRYPSHIDNILNYNYVMYQNEAYSNKWFYAFITDMTYINDNMTEIKIKEDVYQTWQFDLIFKSSFVEREHVNDDGYGKHTYPENLETGEYISMLSSDFGNFSDSHIVMGTTISPVDGESVVGGGVFGGIYSGVAYYIFQSVNALDNALKTIAEAGNSGEIVSLFYCPDWITGYATATFSGGIARVSSSVSAEHAGGIAIPLHPTKIGNYTPKNRKLFTYPYMSYVISNNAGGSVEYHLEDFLNDGSNIGEVDIYGTCCPGASIRLIPKNYKIDSTSDNIDHSNEYGLNGGKFPIASYGNDTYTNWLTQNSVNMGVGAIGSIGSIIGGATLMATGVGALAGAGMVAGGIMGVTNQLTSIYEHKFNPIKAEGNVNSGDVTFSSGKLVFSSYLMCIKEEYAKIIDNYFTMYGYKVNTLKVPNLTGRRNWNFIKTIGANIEGDVPESAIQEIKNMFNNGVTIWHNPATYLDYSQSNDII